MLRPRSFHAAGALCAVAASAAFLVASPTASTTATASSGLPGASRAVVPPGSEGPAGPPARLPNGQVAPPPSQSPRLAPSAAPSQATPYGVNYYAPPFGGAKTVALTFDDGPGPSTQGIISVLRRYGVTATFFNIGQNSAAYPGLVRTEAADGYLVENHTWSHPLNMNTLSSSSQAAQMNEATAEQESLIGWGPAAFRPPGGNYNSTTLSLAQQRGMKVWLWSVDTEDWKAYGSSASSWVNRIISLAESEGASQSHPVVLMHNAPSGDPATVLALPTIINYYRSHGYTFVNLAGGTGNGYDVLASNGGVHNFGAPWYGSAAGTLGSTKAIALTTDPATGGYWILKDNGGVANYNAPWHGSLAGQLPAGVKVTAIAASRGGYLILTSDGGVHNFGAPWYGSARGTLGTGTALGLASDPATGGYWILKDNGGVANYNAPWHGSLAGQIATGAAPAITGGLQGGYYVLTSNGGVHNFGAPWHGSAAGTLGSTKAIALTTDPATGGYWILKDNGGVANYNAPWHGSLAGQIATGAAPAITGGV